MALQQQEQPLRHVMVIDDDPGLLTLLADSLRLLGAYQVMTVTDGAQGLEQIAAQKPDCIVVDVLMPELDGMQLMRALRGDPTTADIPIVVLSALIQDRDRIIGQFSGADAYLFKPVKLDDLLDTVAAVMRLTTRQRTQRALVMADLTDEMPA